MSEGNPPSATPSKGIPFVDWNTLTPQRRKVQEEQEEDRKSQSRLQGRLQGR